MGYYRDTSCDEVVFSLPKNIFSVEKFQVEKVRSSTLPKKKHNRESDLIILRGHDIKITKQFS